MMAARMTCLRKLTPSFAFAMRHFPAVMPSRRNIGPFLAAIGCFAALSKASAIPAASAPRALRQPFPQRNVVNIIFREKDVVRAGVGRRVAFPWEAPNWRPLLETPGFPGTANPPPKHHTPGIWTAYGPETGSACVRAGSFPCGSNAGDNELTRCREPWIRSGSC